MAKKVLKTVGIAALVTFMASALVVGYACVAVSGACSDYERDHPSDYGY